jgi:hypothetical protein
MSNDEMICKMMKMIVTLTWIMELNLIRQYDKCDEEKKKYFGLYDVINIFHLIYLVSFVKYHYISDD